MDAGRWNKSIPFSMGDLGDREAIACLSLLFSLPVGNNLRKDFAAVKTLLNKIVAQDTPGPLRRHYTLSAELVFPVTSIDLETQTICF